MKLNQIITIINSGIEASLSDVRFNGSQFFGLSQLFPRENEYFPYQFDFNGQGTYVGYEDLKVRIYHRLLNSIDLVPEGNTGDGNKIKAERLNLILICMADMNRIRLMPDDLASLIKQGMPIALTSTQRQTLNLHTASIEANGTDYSTEQLFQREFRKLTGQNSLTDPNMIMFEIRYTIECTYNKSCIDTLCC